MALSKLQRAELGRHSTTGVETAAAQLGRFLAHRRWLGTSNVYGPAASDKLKRDRQAKRAAEGRSLGQYIAASSPLHALDGWAFIARALDATTKGDPDAARHLAYYAELRAALSLLAAQGIGVFNRTSAVVEASGDVRVFGGSGTHDMTWYALRHWMRSAEASGVVADIVRQSGETLATWVSDLPHGGLWAPVGARWLSTWGVDLKDAVHDREARNKASYAPTRLYNARPPSPAEARAFVGAWWAALEPSGAAPFEALDRHLLRATLDQIFLSRTGHAPSEAPDAFRADVAAVKSSTLRDGSLDDSLGRFLVHDLDPDPCPLLAHAALHDPPSTPRQHFQVISRATLLLRLATGAATTLLERAGLAEHQLRFWIESVGEDRALWIPGSRPDPLTDLWADVETALNDLPDAGSLDLSSYKHLQDRCAQALAVLTGAERVALWGAVA